MALRAIYILFEIPLFFDSPCTYTDRNLTPSQIHSSILNVDGGDGDNLLSSWMEQTGGVVTRGRVDVWVRTELQVVTIGWSVETEDGAVLSENLHIRISSVQMQQINCRLQTVLDTWHGPGPGHRRDTSQHSLLCACAARSMQFTFRCDWKYLLERMGCSQQQQQMEQN